MTASDTATKAIIRQITRPAPDVIRSVAQYGTATLHEAAAQRGALPAAIKPVALSFRVCGPAVTVLSPPRDNLWLHRAIYLAAPGDVLVVDVSDYFEAGYWGEIMSHAAAQRKLGGLVINGCVRDRDLLERLAFPVFSRGLSIRGTGKDTKAPGAINHAIRVGEVIVNPGDLVAGDADGVVVLPSGEIGEIVAKAKAREDKEEEVIKGLAAGKSTLEIYDFDPGADL